MSLVCSSQQLSKSRPQRWEMPIVELLLLGLTGKKLSGSHEWTSDPTVLTEDLVNSVRKAGPQRKRPCPPICTTISWLCVFLAYTSQTEYL